MIRLVKWTYDQCDLGDLLPCTFYVGIGNLCFFISKFKGGITFSVHLHNLYELTIFSKKKRKDLIEFGFDDVKYFEIGK